MSTTLSPIVSEFDTQEQADSYDLWFRAKVEASLAEPGRAVPHDEVMARMDAIIEAAEARQRSGS
ncbi:stability determinant [Pseudomonas viridiflava]|uniref:type II toxin-antitoxin system RelB family antitoxin n=1 Tax=Pseudomonas viridiflava TaxID=33069 RepID=UPI000F017745|nr:stability determinant [Pseudomonas viridiflava]MEE4124617.1 stability determinant [Pseudomonas viridiflava]QVI84185.1 stability determinant [Pseudomonas viridiflava]